MAWPSDGHISQLHTPGRIEFIANDDLSRSFPGHNGFADNEGVISVTIKITRP